MKILKLFILVFITNISFAQEASKEELKGVSIKITIDNVRSDEGHVLLALHTKDTFMKGPGIQNASVVSENGVAVAVFENVLPGSYAIMALHDKNDNNRMDFEPSGMPKEDYGTSNNVMAFGPPSFMDSEIAVTDKDLELVIKF